MIRRHFAWLLFLVLPWCTRANVSVHARSFNCVHCLLRRNKLKSPDDRPVPFAFRGGSIITTAPLPNGTENSKQGKIQSVRKNANKKSPTNDSLPLSKRIRTAPNVPMLIRILFLTYYASLGALMPYLPVYYHSLGHGGLIIGLLGAVKPFTTFLVAPFWGIVSDRSSNKFNVLYATFLVSLAGQLLVAFRTDVPFLMIMVFIAAFFNAPVKSLIDSIVLDHLKDKSHYGKMRLWGQLGFGLGSSGVGILLSKSGGVVQNHGELDISEHWPVFARIAAQVLHKLWMNITGYRLLFFAYAALSVPCFLALKTFEELDRAEGEIKNLKEEKNENKGTKKEEATRTMQGIQLLFTNADALLFFFLVFVVGTSSGIIENFAYVRMREVGGTGKEMGLSRLVSSAAGAPMFWFSGPLSQKLGADKILVLALLSYVMRFLIYAWMRNPYHGLPAEALRGITFAAFWSTGTIYAHRISPAGMNTTMLMFLNAMYGGLGQSVGAIIGGKLQSTFGTVKTFVYSAIFDFVFVICVSIYFRFRKDSNFKNPQPIQATGITLKRS